MDNIGAAVVHTSGIQAPNPSRKKSEACNRWNQGLCTLEDTMCRWMHICNICKEKGHKHAIVLSLSIDESLNLTYTSALNSYITFCRLHHFPIEPTEETLSFFAVYMSTFIKPDSVNSYLSGVANQLEPFFPNIRTHRNSNLVKCMMAGCRRRFGSPIKCKQPLSKSDLKVVIEKLGVLHSHDERLFLMILLTGCHGLMRLGELCFPNRIASRNYRKISLRHTVIANGLHYSFFLPGHKGDRFFEGNTIIIQHTNATTNPYLHFILYLASHDHLHPFQPELWLREDGEVPTRNFSQRTSEVSLCMLGGPHLSLRLVWLLLSFRLSAGGPQTYIRKNPCISLQLFSHFFLSSFVVLLRFFCGLLTCFCTQTFPWTRTICCVFLHVPDHYVQLVFYFIFYIHLINSLLTTSIPPIPFPLLICYRDPHLNTCLQTHRDGWCYAPPPHGAVHFPIQPWSASHFSWSILIKDN
ncbi:hypothetical protein L208DRAFT_1385452 [Tricholoma matsutake]|nr:hypothetical protein L208DRAFT_1385452 [Tricholoma matsutake 945]